MVVNDFFECATVESENDCAKALHEAAIGVAAEARITGQISKAVEGLAVESKVQHGVHHSGHGYAGARAHGDQQRVGGIAEALPGLHLDVVERAIELLLHSRRKISAAVEVGQASLGGDREPRRHGDVGAGHLGGAGAFAAEQIAHGLGALAEQVNPLVVGVGHAETAPTSEEIAPRGYGAHGSRMYHRARTRLRPRLGERANRFPGSTPPGAGLSRSPWGTSRWTSRRSCRR